MKKGRDFLQPKTLKVTEENQALYLDQIAALEIKVLNNMEENGKTGQLFITGKEDISEYIKSKENSVLVAVDDNNHVISAAYITQGQEPFTYNDITKYFKYGKDYQDFVHNDYYRQNNNYRMMLAHCYCLKLMAFEKAKSFLLRNHSEFNDIYEYIDHEVASENGFDEKNELRDSINKYMAQYMKKIGWANDFEKFYWVTADDIFKAFGERGTVNSSQAKEYEYFLKHAQLEIHHTKLENAKTYYESNTSNAVEIDTYITDPNCRHSGLARILVYEGIKDKILEGFQDPKKQEMYLCSTLHKDNLSSKYVSEFFGLTDNVFVKRRANRDREVHICRIDRNNYQQYLEDMQDKLIVLYGYNPTGKELSPKRQIEILDGQIQYEQEQFENLNKAKNQNLSSNSQMDDSIIQKSQKAEALIQKKNDILQKQGDVR